MWKMLSRLSRFPKVGVGIFSPSFFKTTQDCQAAVPNFLQIKNAPFARGFGIRFTPRSLLVGRVTSPISNRLPCLSQRENPDVPLRKPHFIELGITKKKINVPQRFPVKPISAPSATVIAEYDNCMDINEIPSGLKEILAPEHKKFEIYAARLIVIRRRKMKKHKLKKLRKKMKFEWAKVRQRREMRKEKAFQAGLLEEIRLAEKFNAEEWALDVLRRAKETPVVRRPRKTQDEIEIGKYGRILEH